MTITGNGLIDNNYIDYKWYQPQTYTSAFKCPNCKCDSCAPKVYSQKELDEAIKKAVDEYVSKGS